MRLDAGSEEEAVVNLVPLLDVMFLLLIFFLVSTTFTKDEVDMNLVLPEARSGAPAESGNLLVINVAQDGAITVDGRQVATMEALQTPRNVHFYRFGGVLELSKIFDFFAKNPHLAPPLPGPPPPATATSRC